uniref:Uncharacterized protein n=1 Tax=Rhabditophanes sp. KR3021 TaxID=114890 RepID=A0AC35UDH2_9BILA
MGIVQSNTNRAAKFSGGGQATRSRSEKRSAGQVVRSSRSHGRSYSSCNVSRNAKDFSRFWMGGGQLVPQARKVSGVNRKMSSSVRDRDGKRGSLSKHQLSVSSGSGVSRKLSDRSVEIEDINYLASIHQQNISNNNSINEKRYMAKMSLPCRIGDRSHSENNRKMIERNDTSPYINVNSINIKRQSKYENNQEQPTIDHCRYVPTNLYYAMEDLKL